MSTLSSTQIPQFNTSVQHKDHIFSALKIRQFPTKNSSVQETPQFNRILSMELRGWN